MKKNFVFLSLLAAMLGTSNLQGEFRQIDLTIFGMD